MHVILACLLLTGLQPQGVWAQTQDESTLDALYSKFSTKVIGDADPAWAGLDAKDNFLAEELIAPNLGLSGERDQLQFEYLYQTDLAKKLVRLLESGATTLPDDLFDYLLSREADDISLGLGMLFLEAAMPQEYLTHLTMAKERYFRMIDDYVLVHYISSYTPEERRQLIALAKEDAEASKQLYLARMKSALGHLAKTNPEIFKKFITSSLWHLSYTRDRYIDKYDNEVEVLKKMGLTVFDDEPFGADSKVCKNLEPELARKKLRFAATLLDPIMSLNQARQSQEFSEYLALVKQYDNCVLSLYRKFDDERSLLLINSTLSFADSWYRSKKRLHYGDDLFFLDGVIEQAMRFQNAHFLGIRGEENITPEVFLEDTESRRPLIDAGVKRLLATRRTLIAHKDKGVDKTEVEAMFAALKRPAAENETLPSFGQWLIDLGDPPPPLKLDQRFAAAKNWLQLGRLYLMREEPAPAREQFLSAITLAPRWWNGWRYLGRSGALLNRQSEAAAGYEKALVLIQGCRENAAPVCEDNPLQHDPQEYGRILYGAGYAHLHLGNYGKAADFLKTSLAYAPADYNQSTVEWLAVARFAEQGLDAAWQEYRHSFQGIPLPNHYEGRLSAAQFRDLQEPPAAFVKMIRAGLLDLEGRAKEADNGLLQYLHAQQTARIEAAADKYGRCSASTRRRLLELYLANTRAQKQVRLQPALSARAVKLAQKAEKELDRGRFIEAEKLYRAALVTDPCWLDGLYNLARLELINWGHCGPTETLDWMQEVIGAGVVPADLPPDDTVANPYLAHVNNLQAELRHLFKEAEKSGSGEIIGLCDKPGVSYIRPDIAIPAE